MIKHLKKTNLFRQACFINGEWVQALSGKTFSVNNPYDNSILGQVPECGIDEAAAAVNAAHSAWDKWKNLTAKERADLLYAWSTLIEEHKQDLSLIMTQEQGKPFAESLAEIDYANAFIKWFAEESRRVYGDIIPSNVKNQHLLVIKQSIGVVAVITPWNFPAAMITRKVAAALAAGCTVVVKPAEATPFTALALAVLAEQAGIPPGVLNIITGQPKEIGGELTRNPLVRKLSFTGSTAVGKLLMQACAPTLKKVSLELGGNAPFIIFDDADMDSAIKGLMLAKFRNSGQTCVCANRIYVHQAIYSIFIEKLTQAIKQLKLGNGLDSEVTQGPLINQAAITKVQAHIDDAVSKGAQLILGGKKSALGDYFFEPTLLIDANSTMKLAQQETFGPVAAIFKFNDEAEVIKAANATEFGLAAYFYSNTMQRIWRVASALDSGMVGINSGLVSTEVAPFGGVKESGIGREGSKYGIEEYLEIKYLCMADD